MSYRKVLEKQSFPAGSPASSFSFPGGDDNGTPSAGNAVADHGDDSGLVSSFVSVDLDVGDVLARAVQVGPLFDSNCQPCAGDDSNSIGSGVDVSLDVDAGLDTNGLAIATQGLCLPDLPSLSLPVLSDLLASGECASDHDDGTDSAPTDSACGCESATGNAEGDISISANLDVGGSTNVDVLSALLNGTALLGDSAQLDGVLAGAILEGCGIGESGVGIQVDAELLPAIGSVLDGLVGSADVAHLWDCSASGA